MKKSERQPTYWIIEIQKINASKQFTYIKTNIVLYTLQRKKILNNFKSIFNFSHPWN